jgi:hypothetical protein
MLKLIKANTQNYSKYWNNSTFLTHLLLSYYTSTGGQHVNNCLPVRYQRANECVTMLLKGLKS